MRVVLVPGLGDGVRPLQLSQVTCRPHAGQEAGGGVELPPLLALLLYDPTLTSRVFL